MDTTEKSEYLFNKLKRKGECWHEWTKEDWGNTLLCADCGTVKYSRLEDNPDFLFPPSEKEWEYFGWMWERITITGNRKLEDFRQWCEVPLPALISCTALAEALYKYFKEEV